MTTSLVSGLLPGILAGCTALAMAGLPGDSMADDSSPPAEARSARAVDRSATGEIDATVSAVSPETDSTTPPSPTRRGRPLTRQQRRIFVLGLGASEQE